MERFMAHSPEVQQERANMYTSVDADTAHIIAEYLDHIIDSQVGGRSARCSEEILSEWFETTVLLADMDAEISYPWPLTQKRMMVRRNDERVADSSTETYTVVMEWSVLRDDLIDPSYSSIYVLMIPDGNDSEDPQLLLCQQQSAFISGYTDEQATLGTNESNYHEVDVLLARNFYDTMSRGTEYDAEQLFDELTIFSDMLTH